MSTVTQKPNPSFSYQRYRGLSLSAWKVYYCLLMKTNRRGQTMLSFNQLAKATQLSRKSVIRSIKNLKAHRLLKIAMRSAYGGENVYDLKPTVGSLQLIRQIWLMGLWLELGRR
jgi:hypothetical protein